MVLGHMYYKIHKYFFHTGDIMFQVFSLLHFLQYWKSKLYLFPTRRYHKHLTTSETEVRNGFRYYKRRILRQVAHDSEGGWTFAPVHCGDEVKKLCELGFFSALHLAAIM